MSNIDEELNEKFNEMFSGEREENISPLFAKMQEKNIQQFMEESYSAHEVTEREKGFVFSSFERKEIVDDMWKEWFDIQSIKGKHFQISNKKGCKTVIYRVIPRIDYEKKAQYIDLEKLVSSIKESVEDNIQMFFVDEPAIDGEDLILLHYYTLKGDVYVNRGSLKNDRLVLSKPLLFHSPKQGIKKTQNSSMYLLDDTENKQETWYDANSDADKYISEQETGEEVLRERYWDEKEKCYKYKIKIDSDKQYFSFQVRFKEDNCSERELTDLEIGRYYRTGRKGFPRDEYEAMKYLERTESPESDYEIAEIFLKGQDFRNEKLGLEYIKKSADKRFSPACVELAILYSILDFNGNKEAIKKYIDDAIRNEFAPALFVKAYAYEIGFSEEIDRNQSFRLYYRAAQMGFYPALCRFATCDGETTDDPDVIYINFLESSNGEPEYATFCLGMMLLHNNYISWKDTESHHIEPFEKEGFQIMLKAALKGCKEAMYQVALSYLCGLGVPKNREAALEWYDRIENDNRIYYVRAMCLFMQDKSVFEFDTDEIEILEYAAEYDMDGTICNELGLYNRFNEEYERAIDYFHRAIDKGWSLACYYLAELYSEDYDSVSLEQIIQLYEKGASMGCKECEEKLQSYYQKNLQESEESFSHTLKVIAQDMNDRIDSINSKIDEVNERTKDVQEELRNLSVFVKEDLTMFIREQKRQLSQQIQNDSEKNELMVSQLCTDVSRYINTRMACSNEVDINKETEYLISIFGRSWDKLEKESRTSLISAGVLWKLCADIKGDFDYSGICISATSALETELKKYFFVGFQKYLENTYGAPFEYKWEETFNNWPEILLSTSRKRYKREWNNYKYQGGDRPRIRKEKDTYFTLGKMPFIFGVRKDEDVSEEQQELLTNRLNEYLSTFITIPSDKTAIDVFIGGEEGNSFIDKCERIRTEYRNKAAHDDILSEEQAKGCYHEVIGKIESYKYTSDVTGLLLQLFQHIK